MSIRTKQFRHTNTTNDKESVVTLTSTEKEQKKIRAVRIISEVAQDGNLEGWVENTKELEHPTNEVTIRNSLEYPLDIELPVGRDFELTLTNVVAGSNAGVAGVIEYEVL